MKSIRRGLGRGKGMGYKNIVPHDRPVHRDSGRGIKQPQLKMIPPVMMKQGMRKSPYHKFTTEDYYNMGKRSGLGGYSLKKYSAFMQLRFPEETDPAYAREWARAFSEGKEYVKADVESQRILDNLDSSPFIELIQKDVGGLGDKYGVMIDGKLIPYEVDDKSKAETDAKRWKGEVVNLTNLRKGIPYISKESSVGRFGDKMLLIGHAKGYDVYEDKEGNLYHYIGKNKEDFENQNFWKKFYTARDRKEKIVGGLGDNRPDSAFSKAEIKKGMKVEMEHTKDPAIAKEIVKDHLSEFSGKGKKGYYDNLLKLETELKNESHFVSDISLKSAAESSQSFRKFRLKIPEMTEYDLKRYWRDYQSTR